jgi:rhomboid protease GluP
MLRRVGADFGFAETVTAACLVLYVAMLLHSGARIQMRGLLGFLSPAGESLFIFGASGALPVYQFGRWWSILSAGWLHASALHILFNLLWIRQLGPAAVELFGTGRTIIIYTVGSCVGFLLSSTAYLFLGGLPIIGGGALTLGASAPIFGLLGAMVHYGRQASSMVKSQAAGYAMTLFIFGILMPGIDNWAHAGGFVGGYLASFALNPMRPERGNHLLIAFVCLAATAVSIVASLIVR